MKNIIRNRFLHCQAAFIVTMWAGARDARANNFSDIAENIIDSIAALPSLLASIAYLIGILFGFLGVLKLKDHVDDPNGTPLRDGAIRLAGGGALLGLPIIFEAMHNTIGETTTMVRPVEMPTLKINVR